MFISSEFFSILMTISWLISTCLLLKYLKIHKEEIADRNADRNNRRNKSDRRNKKKEPKINNDNDDTGSVENV